MVVQSGPGWQELFAAARAAREAGRVDEAAAGLRRVLALRPDHVPSLALLGALALQQRDYAQSVACLARTLELEPPNPERLRLLSRAHLGAGRGDEALACLDRALALAPQRAQLQAERGDLLLRRGDHAAALQAYDRALALQPSAGLFNARGTALLRLGRVDDALASFQQAIAGDPDLAPAHFNCATALQRLERHAAALEAYDRALALRPDHVQGHANRGNALRALRRNDEALTAYDRALALAPDNVEAAHNRASLLRLMQRHEEALAGFAALLERAPDMAAAWRGRGHVLRETARPAEALAAYERALALEPQAAGSWLDRGICLLALERAEEALASAAQALALDPGSARVLTLQGVALRQLGRFEAALASYDAALAIEAADPNIHDARGNVLWDLGRKPQALAAYDRAVALAPLLAAGHVRRGELLRELRRHDEALAAFAEAQRLQPDNPGAHTSEAMCRLQIGDLALGWQAYEWRWKSHDFEKETHFKARPWALRPLRAECRRALVWGEQSVGDVVLYGSMLADLAARGIAVTFEVEPRLVKLFARAFHGFKIIAMADPPQLAAAEAHDCSLPLASLGQYLRPTFDSFPRRPAWLKADPARSAELRRRYRGPDRRRLIGLSWHSTAPRIGAAKGCRLADLAPILRLADTRFVSLQYGDHGAEIAELAGRLGIEILCDPEIDAFGDLDGLAAQIAALDGVITISNTTAHLAGALGRPTALLLPQGRGLHWYWFLDRSDSPWYPSFRLYRQQTERDWSQPVAALAEDLRAQTWPGSATA